MSGHQSSRCKAARPSSSCANPSHRKAVKSNLLCTKRTPLTTIVLVFILTLLIGASLMFAGCGSSETTTTAPQDSSATSKVNGEANGSGSTTVVNEDGITVTDMTGHEVTLSEPATKVVALTASDCEILYALGAGATLVGRGEYCNYPAEIMDVTSVQSGNETNIEQIIALDPQLVLMNTMDQTEEQGKQLEDAGIAVFVCNANSIEETYISIELIGKLMGREAEATAIVDGMKKTFDDLSAKAAAASDDKERTIYYEVSPLEYGLWAGCTDTFMDEVGNMLGLTNIFADLSGWAEISEEQVLERNPDYILTVGMYFGDGPTPIESILSRAGWKDVTAIKNEAILNLQKDELSRPGPRLAEGAQMLYDFVYGDAD